MFSVDCDYVRVEAIVFKAVPPTAAERLSLGVVILEKHLVCVKEGADSVVSIFLFVHVVVCGVIGAGIVFPFAATSMPVIV